MKISIMFSKKTKESLDLVVLMFFGYKSVKSFWQKKTFDESGILVVYQFLKFEAIIFSCSNWYFEVDPGIFNTEGTLK